MVERTIYSEHWEDCRWVHSDLETVNPRTVPVRNDTFHMDGIYHKNVIAGAEFIVELSIYPAAPATIHPTSSPTMILIFFKNGEPKISVKMIETKDRNPRPMN